MITSSEALNVLHLIEEHLATIKICAIIVTIIICWNTLMKFTGKPKNYLENKVKKHNDDIENKD